ncbi:MAG: hypothetical protein E7D27_14025 [Clostridium celatum]|nr:hypothetical protein [Clostridium celatum]
MEITKREIIASISIVAVMLIIGVIIQGNISEKIMDSNEKYNKAIKVEDEELFKYGMRTSSGNAFVYGELEVLDPVTYPEIGGEYSYIEKVKEKHTRHTRTRTYTVNGKTRTRTETYWTWDRVGSESIKSKKVKFLGVEFDYAQFLSLDSRHIDTIKESSHIRYKYYGSPIKATGTIFTKLQNNNIGNDIKFYENMSIEETYKYLQEGFGLLFLFWFAWILLITGVVYGFYYLDNDWLNIDKRRGRRKLWI